VNRSSASDYHPGRFINLKKPIVTFALLLCTALPLCASEKGFGGIQLLDGYFCKRGSAVDAIVWMIEKRGGTKLEFESGPSEGSWADPKDMGHYAWYREQRVNGYTVRFALIKPGLKTVWEPEDRHEGAGNILLVTFLLDGNDSSHTANFKAKIKNTSDLGDVLLMVMTFDPSKGNF
jgi:hypothetical protein